MSLPLPPKPQLPLPPTGHVENITVRKVGHDKLEVRVYGITKIITRSEAFRLLGQLEREAETL